VLSLGIFSMVPLTEPCVLRSTQPLKVSNRDFSWGKGGRCVWLTTYHPCSAETSRKSGALTYPEPLGPPWHVTGDLYFTFIHLSILFTQMLAVITFTGNRHFELVDIGQRSWKGIQHRQRGKT